MNKSLQDVLTEQGYQQWDRNEGNVYQRETEQSLYTVMITRLSNRQEEVMHQAPDRVEESHYRAEAAQIAAGYEQLTEEVRRYMQNKTNKHVHLLHLVCVQEEIPETISLLVNRIQGVWIIREDELALLVYENQPAQFDQLYQAIGDFVANCNQERKKADRLPVTGPVTIGLIVVNLLVYFYLAGNGNVYDAQYMYEKGASMWPSVVYGHEYYRLFTCMFMHFGMAHLANNMFVLAITGDQLEHKLGRMKYLFLYLGSGLLASITSVVANMSANELAVSAGASGAIYGVIGGVVLTMLVNRKKDGEISLRRILMLVALTIYLFFTETGVDNWAHLGGFVSGFLISGVFSLWNHLRGKGI